MYNNGKKSKKIIKSKRNILVKNGKEQLGERNKTTVVTKQTVVNKLYFYFTKIQRIFIPAIFFTSLEFIFILHHFLSFVYFDWKLFEIKKEIDSSTYNNFTGRFRPDGIIVVNEGVPVFKRILNKEINTGLVDNKFSIEFVNEKICDWFFKVKSFLTGGDWVLKITKNFLTGGDWFLNEIITGCFGVTKYLGKVYLLENSDEILKGGSVIDNSKIYFQVNSKFNYDHSIPHVVKIEMRLGESLSCTKMYKIINLMKKYKFDYYEDDEIIWERELLVRGKWLERLRMRDYKVEVMRTVCIHDYCDNTQSHFKNRDGKTRGNCVEVDLKLLLNRILNNCLKLNPIKVSDKLIFELLKFL